MPSPPAFAVEQRDAPAGVVLLALEGELDMAAAPTLRTRLDAAGDEGGTAVVLDLAAVTFIDSSALHEFLEGSRRLRARGARLILAGATPEVGRVFELTGTREVLALVRTVEQALERAAG